MVGGRVGFEKRYTLLLICSKDSNPNPSPSVITFCLLTVKGIRFLLLLLRLLFCE